MDIERTFLKIDYIRSIESVGTLSTLFKVRRKIKGAETNNHFCYSDKDLKISIHAKIPLDIAVRPCDSVIEYISFFINKNELLISPVKNNIIYSKSSIFISDQRFNSNKFYIDEKMEFNQYIQNRDVFVISKEAKKNLIGYRLDDDHYILFDDEDNFSGVVFKNLTDKQMEELKKSNVI